MKKCIAVLLVIVILVFSACDAEKENNNDNLSNTRNAIQTENLDFTGLDDPSLLTYYDDAVYSYLIDDLNSSDFFIENIESKYISKEYLEEITYNSQENVYFGFNLSSLEEQFKGEKFIFSLDSNNQTAVKAFEGYDDSFEKEILKNVAIGSGVILTCVTVSVVTAGAGMPAASIIFAASAKSATTFALSGTLISGLSAGILTGIETKNFDKALTEAAVKGSEGFKWGAISGALAGGAKETFALKGATTNGLTMNEAAIVQKESKYPIDVIKQFKSMDQYNICKEAGLEPQMVNGKTALVRKIDLDFEDEMGRTNIERMKQGLSAIDPSTGESYQLHHIGQKNDSTLAILTESEHMQNGNNSIWHIIGKQSEIDRPEFDKIRADFWKSLAEILVGG